MKLELITLTVTNALEQKSHIKKKKIHLFKRHRVDSECNRAIFEEVSFGGEKGKRKNPAILKMVCAFSDYF